MTPSAPSQPRARALRRRRRHRLVSAILATSFLAVTIVPGANAFNSSYCGHNTSPGASGARVVYKHAVQVGAMHYHRYKHQLQFLVWVTVHERNHQCPSAPHGN